MKPFNILALMAVAYLALAGCSSTPTRVDKGPIHATSFSFLHPGPLPQAAFTENRQQIHAVVQEAIANHLVSKGLSRRAEGGEVTVAYLIIVGNDAITSSINDYFGYGHDALELQDKAHQAYTGSDTRNYFEAGTLVIDIIDSRTQKLMARNCVTRPVLRNAPLDVRQTRIQEAVDAALKQLIVKR